MTREDRHIFLYAKGHYQEKDVIEDMKKILERRCALDAEHITVNDICHVLMPIVYNFINNEYQFTNFVFNLSPDNHWKLTSDKNIDFSKILILNYLSVLRHQKITDIPFELEKPDPTLLPLKQI